MADPDADKDSPAVTREEHEKLLRRIERLEEAVRAQQRQPPPAPAPRPLEPPAAVARLPPTPAPPAPAPPAPRPVAPVAPAPPAGTPWYAAPPAAHPPQLQPPAARAATSAGFEAMLGQRFAPRIGAVLVFLAALFFLGVGIQRGWVGPLAQLTLAVAASGALLGVAAWLTRGKTYGTYPQVLEGTAASILYATAFVAYALPYYQEQTRLTEVGGGVLMALVAAGTVALALARDSRVIVGLGYLLAFLTAGFGAGLLPGLTIPYVAILGASLALVVARRGWLAEGALGSVATGAFFVGFAIDAVEAPPSAALVLASAAVPVVALLWLSMRPLARPAGDPYAAMLAFATLGWGAAVSVIPFFDDSFLSGLILLAWTAVAAALAGIANAGGAAARSTVTASGTAAVVIFLVAIPALWNEFDSSAVLVTASYAAAALVLSLAHRAVRTGARGLWLAGLALAGIAATKAVFADEWIGSATGAAVFGPWEAWMTFLVLAPALALLIALAPQERASMLVRATFAVGVVYLGAWAFALFGTPFPATLYLLITGAALVAAGSREGALSRDATVAGILLAGAAALKTAAYDPYASDPPLPTALAGLESVLAAATLLALFHLRLARMRPGDRATGAALVGGSAVVLAAFLFAHATGPWTSVLLGILGVGYLAAGFAMRAHAVYRYVGFAALGVVLVRVFSVDLREADLVVRAAVFAALGLILLAIGYAYARANRPKASGATEESLPRPPRPPEPPAG